MVMKNLPHIISFKTHKKYSVGESTAYNNIENVHSLSILDKADLNLKTI